MTSDDDVWSGFIAAMLHDIGKLVGISNHEDLDAIKDKHSVDFDGVLGTEVTRIIKNHHNKVKIKNLIEKGDLVQASLNLADRFEKAMYKQQKLDKLFTKFYPFYGFSTTWDSGHGISRLKQILDDIEKTKKGELSVKNLLDVQKYFLDVPSITYLPYISIAMHHQFTATLFLIINSKLKNGASLDSLKFSLIEVSPDPLKLFYRLRDIHGHTKIVEKLNREIFQTLFKDYAKILHGHGMYPDINPFNFYYGDGFVFLYENEPKAIDSLKHAINKVANIQSINIRVNNYTLFFDWGSEQGKEHAPPEKTIAEPAKRFTIISDEIINYSKDAMHRCSACGKPIAEKSEDEEGNILCSICSERRHESSGIEIDKIAEKNGKKERVGYVFVSLPDDLIVHAKSIARNKLLSRFIDEFSLYRYAIDPTETGLFEYLQALLELEKFQNDVSNKIDNMKAVDMKADPKNLPCEILFELPNSMCYIFREHNDDTQLWDFLPYLNIKRFDLQLDTSAKIFICNYKTPFWSLIDFESFGQLKGDMFCNLAGGNITMFAQEEVRKIRELAESAKKYRVYPTQLERLSSVAMETNIDELLLEINVSADKLRGFEKSLIEGIKSLKEEGYDYQNKEKRSVFIKYIAKLARQRESL